MDDTLLARVIGECRTRDPLGNPLRELWETNDPLNFDADTSQLAWRLSRTFSCAVPNDDALDAIAARGPVIEVGAGTGYWARLLADRGVDVVAYDLHPHGCGCGQPPWCGRNQQQWYPVQRAGAEIAGAHPDRALLIVWPPSGAPMAAEALAVYRNAGGRDVLYVGEGAGGINADDTFHAMLGEPVLCLACVHERSCSGCRSTYSHDHIHQLWGNPRYRRVEHVALPVHYSGDDSLWVYARRQPLRASGPRTGSAHEPPSGQDQ